MPLSSFLVLAVVMALTGLIAQQYTRMKRLGQVLMVLGVGLFTLVSVTIAVVASGPG